MLINTLLTRYKSLFYAKKHFPIHLIALLLTGCITDFIPEVKGTRDILVVEGTITNGTSIFRLSRSVSITDTLKGDHMITDAWLGVERDDGLIIPATNLGHGSYSVATGELDPQASYRLRFTIGDKPYHSTFLSPVETAAIDSVTYRKKGLGKPLEILVSTQGEKKGSPYYRWNYWETWEIKAPIFAKHGYIDGKLTQFSMLTSLNTYYCWGRDSSKIMLLETTDKLSENRVDRKKLFEIPCDDERISILYHLRVSQTQLHEEAYDYFRAMQEAIERTGDLFSLVMSGGENGNVFNDNDPDELIIGYVDVATTTWTELFIPYDFDLYEPKPEYCTIFEQGKDVQAWVDYDKKTFSTFPCVDCRTRLHASKERPEGWPTDHY